MKSHRNDIGADSSEEEQESRFSRARNGRTLKAIGPRANASAGYWLCMLLPLALATNHLHKQFCTESVSATQAMLTIAAIGMCIETLCFFLYMFFMSGLLLKLLIAFLPGLVTTLLYKVLLQQPWSFGLFWGFVITFCYQNTFIRVMRDLPHCFSFGEAAVLVQGLMLFVINCTLRIYDILFVSKEKDDFAELNVIMMCSLFLLLFVCVLLAAANTLRKPISFYLLMTLLALGVTCIPITKPVPIVTLFKFILKDESRLSILCFYLALVAFTVLTVSWQIGSEKKASTRIRKIFHLLLVLVYVPGLIYQCALLYIASGVALAMLTIFELFRICDVPPLSATLGRVFATFSDEKDGGVLALTPFCLLIGCSLPMWICPCPCAINSYGINPQILSLMAGVLTIGFGDTAASVIGSKFGCNKWRNSKKTVEGTFAFMVVTLGVILCFNLFGVISMSPLNWFAAIAATLVTALVEAHTDQIDNLTLPIIFYTIVNIS